MDTKNRYKFNFTLRSWQKELINIKNPEINEDRVKSELQSNVVLLLLNQIFILLKDLHKFYENSGNNKETEQLLTLEDVCFKLKVKESFIRGLLFRKRIPVIKIGKFIRFEKHQLDNWLKENSLSERRTKK